jgi:hypothetical protein
MLVEDNPSLVDLDVGTRCLYAEKPLPLLGELNVVPR